MPTANDVTAVAEWLAQADASGIAFPEDYAAQIFESDWMRARDRERDAQAIEAFAKLQELMTRLHDYAMDEDDWDEHERLVTSLRNYAALIRKGERP